MGVPIVIDSFNGQYRFLSNFYICPVEWEGIVYTSAEAAYQSAKSINEFDRIKFKDLSPNESKRLGNKILLRDDWEDIKLFVMKRIVTNKFIQNTDLKYKLFKTGSALLIEGNWWNDTYWGICNGKGQNHLGKILMQIRKDLVNKPN